MKAYVKLGELLNWRYWVHLIIISMIVLGSLQLFYGGDMFTGKNVAVSAFLIGFADIIAHWVVRLE